MDDRPTFFQRVKRFLRLGHGTEKKASDRDGSLSSVNTKYDDGSVYGSANSLDSTGRGGLTKDQYSNLMSNNGIKKAIKPKGDHKNPNLDAMNATYDEVQSSAYMDQFANQNAAMSDFKEAHPMYDTTYFLFKPNHPIRRFCKTIVGNKGTRRNELFSWVISLAIIASVVILAYDTPLSRKNNLDIALDKYAISIGKTVSELNLQNPDPPLVHVLRKSEYLSNIFYIGERIFVAIFTAEFLIRTIADGVLFTPNAYLLNAWNWLDLVVLLTMWLGVTFQFVDATGFPRFIRVIRALRPLRLISQFSGLKSIIQIILLSLVGRMEIYSYSPTEISHKYLNPWFSVSSSWYRSVRMAWCCLPTSSSRVTICRSIASSSVLESSWILIPVSLCPVFGRTAP